VISQRAGVNLHDEAILQRQPRHLHQEVAHEAPFVRRRYIALPGPLVQDLRFVGRQPNGIGLEHRVIGGRSPHALEERTAIPQCVDEFTVVHQGRAVLSAQRFQLGRPAGGGDLKHRVGRKQGITRPGQPEFPDGLMVLQWIAGLVGRGEELDRETLEQRPRAELGEASFSVISSYTRDPVSPDSRSPTPNTSCSSYSSQAPVGVPRNR